MRDAGFEAAGTCQFLTEHDWTAEDLAGFALSTSVLSRAALGGMTEDFAADLRRELHASQPDGRFRQAIDFACDLARRPA